MKKIFKTVVFTALALTIFTACGNSTDSSNEKETITVGASVVPHAEILSQATQLLSDKGYELEIIEYTDYILPNTALDAGDLDANFFQHTPYLEQFNAENGTDISSALSVHFEPLGIYSDKITALSDLPDGAKIAVPNDATNEARALLLLESNGIIKLDENAGINATKLDIVENPYNVEIVEIEAAQLPRVLPDVDLACINGNYALQGGLNAEDAIAFEANNSLSAQTYANILAVNTEDLDSEKTKALVEALSDEAIKSYIEENYDGVVVAVSE